MTYDELRPGHVLVTSGRYNTFWLVFDPNYIHAINGGAAIAKHLPNGNRVSQNVSFIPKEVL